MSARSEQESPRVIHGWLVFPLTGVFIVLKLAGVTDWSWWWVFSPFLIAAALAVVVAGALALLLVSLALYARIRLHFRLRRAFPEVFIDPAAWSRGTMDHSDTASS
jgi:MFS family permease